MKRFLGMLLYVFLLGGLFAADGRKYSWDFSDCEIKDIVFAVSLDTGISIVCDDTVSGKADFKFSGKDFEVAFDAFLNGNRLFVEKSDVLWTVSRIRIVCEENLFSLDAYDLMPLEIMDKLSCVLEDVVSFDNLPSFKMSVHYRKLKSAELLESLVMRFGNYVVQKNDKGFHISRSIETKRLESAESFINVAFSDGKFLVDTRDSKLCDVIEKVFATEHGRNKNYCFVSNGNLRVIRTCFEEADFDSAIKSLCNQNGFDFSVRDNVYYFYENPEVINQLVFGEKKWICYKLKYSSAQEILPFVLKKVGKLDTFAGPDNSCFYANATEDEDKLLKLLLKEVDVGKSVYIVNLKYIKPEELMSHLPPCVEKSNLFMADDNSCLYFKGTEEAYKSFCEQIKICDRPEIRVTYDLLIIQYDETFQSSWNVNFGVGNSSFGNRNTISGQLGSVLGLNINILSSFGLNFAATLQSSIEENKSSVYADTILHGINGKTISFTNSSTYRYRDNNLDPETGKPIYSGITREIVSGINIQVTPSVSGDGMITSKVTASISRQGIDTSSTTGNPPPTTEKIITTEVNSKNGEPVVLSGLIQNSLSEDSKGMPVIGQIPLIKNLFNSSQKHKEKSQMIIFLVPRIDGETNYIEKKREKEVCEKIKDLLRLLEV